MKMRRGREKENEIGEDIVINNSEVKVELRRGRRKDIMKIEGIVEKMVGVRIEERCRVNMERREGKVEREGKRSKEGMREKILMKEIMDKEEEGMKKEKENKKNVDDEEIVNINVVKVIEKGEKDENGKEIGILGIGRKLKGKRNDMGERKEGDILGKWRGVGKEVIIDIGEVLIEKEEVEKVIGRKEIEESGENKVELIKIKSEGGKIEKEDDVMIGEIEMLMVEIEEIREGKIGKGIMWVIVDEDIGKLKIIEIEVILLKVKIEIIEKEEEDGKMRREIGEGIGVEEESFKVRIVELEKIVGEVGWKKEKERKVVEVIISENEKNREVGIFEEIIIEIGKMKVEVILEKNEMEERNGKGGIGEMIRVKKEIGEIGGLRIVGEEEERIWEIVEGLSIEMRVGSEGMRKVGEKKNEEKGIVKVWRLRKVCMIEKGNGRRRRKIEIKVVEGNEEEEEKRKIKRERRIGKNRNGRDRREEKKEVREIGIGSIGVGGGDDIVEIIKCRKKKEEEEEKINIIGKIGRVMMDGRKWGKRSIKRELIEKKIKKEREDKRIFKEVGRVDVKDIDRKERKEERLVVRKIREGERIVGMMGLKGDDEEIEIDIKREGEGEVKEMGGEKDIVVMKEFEIGVLKIKDLIGGEEVKLREGEEINEWKEVKEVEE